jgi:hypothetical protein
MPILDQAQEKPMVLSMDETEDLASRMLHQRRRGEPEDRLIALSGETLADPDFGHPTRIHDWRNHVGERVKAIWDTLTHSQRLAVALDAQDRAGNESWD